MKMTQTTYRATKNIAATVFLLLMLGCSVGVPPASQISPTPTGALAFAGHVHGGQNPVAGAVIQLYAVGITGAKSASTPLIAATITSDQNGDFSFTNDWNCTSNTATYGNNPLLYIVASGGDPGIGNGTNNAAIRMMAALGPCSVLTASTFISINELTTVAAAYALAPFMTDSAHVGGAANSVGLANAFNTANVLVNWNTGVAPGANLPATATVPVNQLNTLANILAACVNTTGVGGSCSALFTAATPSGGVAPTDIVGVILDIAAHPASQASALYSMSPSAAPFQPGLSSAPNDWTLGLKFTGGGLNAPAALALDATGNIWVANAGGNGITGLSSGGTLLTGSTGYTGNNNLFGAQGIAVDTSGNVWVADTLLSSVVKLTVSNGIVQSNATYTGGGLNGPVGIAIDPQNNVWVANFAGASVTELNSSGTSVGSSPLTANGTLQAPSGIAIDGAGNVWVTDNSASDVIEFSQNQALLSGSGYTDGAIFAPQGIAIDASGRFWVANNGTNSVSLFGRTGTSLLTTPLIGGGLSMPAAVAVDGQATTWITNSQSSGSISQVAYGQSAPLSPSSGFGSLNVPTGIAVDASGSIWTANASSNSISEFIGIATPAVTPIVSALH